MGSLPDGPKLVPIQGRPESGTIDGERYPWTSAGMTGTRQTPQFIDRTGENQKGNPNGNYIQNWPGFGDRSVPRGFVRKRVHERRGPDRELDGDHDHFGRTVNDSIRYSRDPTGGGSGDSGTAEGRCGVYQFRGRSGRRRPDGP